MGAGGPSDAGRATGRAWDEILPLLRDPATNAPPRADELAARVAPAGWLDFVGADAAERPIGQGLCMQAPWVSRIYDGLWRPFFFTVFARQLVNADQEAFLLQRLLEGRGPVVDLSCGPGTFAGRLHAQPALRPVLGVDLSPSMLDEAARAAPGPYYVRGDAYDLPLRDESVAGVVNAGAFHLYPDPRGVLREVRRVLAPGGVFVLLAFVTISTALARLVRPIEHSVGLTRWSVDEIVTLIEEAGYSSVEPFRFGGRATFRAVK